MTIAPKWWKICTWLLGTVFLISLLTYLSYSLGQVSDNNAEILKELTQANIIYLGETHDNPQDHQAQLTIIQNLQAKKTQIAIALEMFQRPYQPFLDQYLTQTINETELQEKPNMNNVGALTGNITRLSCVLPNNINYRY